MWIFCSYTLGMAGRPKKTETNRRENVLRIRLTESERKIIDKAAKAKSLDASAWTRMILLEAARSTNVGRAAVKG